MGKPGNPNGHDSKGLFKSGISSIVDSNEDLKDIQLAKTEENRKKLNKENHPQLSKQEKDLINQSSEYYEKFKSVKATKKIDLESPESVRKYVSGLIREHDNVTNSNIEVKCSKSAGVTAALFKNEGKKFKWYAGTCTTKGKAEAMGNNCNHVWIEYNGKVYETFPGTDLSTLDYRKPQIEFLFK